MATLSTRRPGSCSISWASVSGSPSSRQSRLHEIAFPIDVDRSVVIADFGRLKARYPYVTMVPQWDLLNLLAEASKEEPSFTLRMRSEITELIRDSGRVEGVRYRADDGRLKEIRADLTVACDGRWSIARNQADLRPSRVTRRVRLRRCVPGARRTRLRAASDDS